MSYWNRNCYDPCYNPCNTPCYTRTNYNTCYDPCYNPCYNPCTTPCRLPRTINFNSTSGLLSIAPGQEAPLNVYISDIIGQAGLLTITDPVQPTSNLVVDASGVSPYVLTSGGVVKSFSASFTPAAPSASFTLASNTYLTLNAVLYKATSGNPTLWTPVASLQLARWNGDGVTVNTINAVTYSATNAALYAPVNTTDRLAVGYGLNFGQIGGVGAQMPSTVSVTGTAASTVSIS